MGIIRLLLALAVVSSHFGSIFSLNFVGGQIAVQSFYIISGFYMTLILNEKYRGVNNSYKLFITNRFLRLYPIYWVLLILTVISFIIIAIIKNESTVFTLSYYSTFPTNTFSLIFLIFSNILIFGQDLVMFLGINTDNGHLFFTSNFMNTLPAFYNFLFIPQAWTLSLELMFYLLAPFILRKRLKIVLLIIVLSIMLRFFIYYSLGFQHDPWTYRFFPTEISFFLFGYLSYLIYLKIKSIQMGKFVWVTVFAGLIVFTIFYSFLPSIKFHFLPFSIKEIIYFLSIIISIPLLFNSLKTCKIDNKIGELSYPVYVSHMLVGVVCVAANNNFVKQGWVIALITIVLSWLLNYFVAKPIERYRQSRFLNNNGINN